MHEVAKDAEDEITLVVGHGVVGDAHAGATVQHRSRVRRGEVGPNLRQVHLLHGELHDELRLTGFDVAPGRMGENVTTSGIALLELPTGALLHLGATAVVEVAGLRNPCWQLDTIQSGLMAACLGRDGRGSIVRKAGVMAVVRDGGQVRPGDVIEVELRRGESNKTVDVELIGDPDDPGRTLVGFLPVDTARVELPFEVDIDTGAIGGPSAGLAFTLSLLDQLTPGDLSPDDVAVTGTIGVEGTVGAIGGLPQKVEAVKMTGVDVFLVPASQGDLDEAQAVAGNDIELVPVADLDEALAALERLGGDPLAATD